mgnify:FL=1
MEYINLNAFDDLIKITYKNANIFLIHDFFKKESLEKIKNKLNEVYHEEHLWQKVHKQEICERRHLKIEEVDFFRELNEEFKSSELINKVKDTLGWDISRGGLIIWHDTEGYDISLHVDNENVKHAIQIYLTGKDNQLGTSFARKQDEKSNDIFMTLPYKENFGYCMKNVDDVVHGLLTKVPKNFDRYSFYSLYD